MFLRTNKKNIVWIPLLSGAVVEIRRYGGWSGPFLFTSEGPVLLTWPIPDVHCDKNTFTHLNSKYNLSSVSSEFSLFLVIAIF